MLKKTIAYLSVLFTVLFVIFAYNENKGINSAETESQNYVKSEVFAEEDEITVYTLKEENGNIIIKYNDDIVETGIKTENLRSYDRDLLKNGIVVESYDEVLKLIEDFNS